MPNFYNRATIAEEAKLLFTLVDEVDQLGLLTNSESLQRWRAVKQNIAKTGYEPETEFLFTLLCEVHATGALAGTPVEPRWLPVKHRIDSAPRRMYPRPP
jgi:hypothetical protein